MLRTIGFDGQVGHIEALAVFHGKTSLQDALMFCHCCDDVLFLFSIEVGNSFDSYVIGLSGA
jgi:hypothetical protein